MAMEEALRARLQAQLACPVDWGWNQQGEAVPRIVLTLVSDIPAYSMDGPSDMVRARVQIDCFAANQGAAIGLARAVTAAISGYAVAPLLGVFIDGGVDLPPDTTAGEVFARRTLSAMVHHRIP